MTRLCSSSYRRASFQWPRNARQMTDAQPGSSHRLRGAERLAPTGDAERATKPSSPAH
jgi:hypothetical protein